MANPVEQIVLWVLELLNQAAGAWDTLRMVAIIALGGLLVWTLVTRVRADDDPSFRYTSESSAGSTSFLVSGVHVTIALVGAIALLAWPAPIQSPLVGLVLAGVVLVHYVIERREAMA